MRATVGHDICLRMKQGRPADKAIFDALETMSERVGGDGGAIALSPNGEIGFDWNSRRMAWAYIDASECYQDASKGHKMAVTVHSGCNRDEHFKDLLYVE